MNTKPQLVDLLMVRAEEIQKELQETRAERETLDIKEKQLSDDLAALQQALRVETRDHVGNSKKQASNGSRLLGLRLGEAVQILRKEHSDITKKGCRKMLEKIGFDFRGKRPGSAVHMAWVALERQKHKGGDT